MATIENMTGGMKKMGVDPIFALVLSVLFLLVLLFLGQYLWNNVLVKVVSGIRPVKSLWEILGLYVLFQILFGR